MDHTENHRIRSPLDAARSHRQLWLLVTAAAPASEVEAVVRSPTNMAAADIAAVDFNKMTSQRRHSTGLLAAMFAKEDLLANRRLQTLLLF